MKYLSLSILALLAWSASFAAVGPVLGNASICAGALTILSDTTSGGTWSSSNTTVAVVGISSGFVTGITAGTSVLIYTTGSGTATLVVTVNPLPVTDTVTGGGIYCDGGMGVHIGLRPSQTGIGYVLYHGASATGPVTGTGTPIDFGLLTTAGTYTILATNTVTGCASPMYGNAEVIISPTVNPVASITSNPGDTVCSGILTTFTAAISCPGAATYKWYVNGILADTTDNMYSFIPSNGDTVNCIVTTSNTCVSTPVATSNTTTMVVPSTPAVPTITISSIPFTVFWVNVTVNAAVANAGSGYTINCYKNGILFNTSTVPFAIYYKEPGVDTITATVVPTSHGCYDSTLSAPITITAIGLGVNNIAAQQLAIFPNPATSSLTIQSGNEPINEVIITNLLGQVVYSSQSASGGSHGSASLTMTSVHIDISSFPAGVYFVKVNGGVQKFVKE